MKTIIAVVSVFLSTCAFAWGFGPGGSGGRGGGGQQPGGGGNQPDQPGGGGGGSGGSSSFTFDTFLTDSATSGGCIVYGDLMTGYVSGQAAITIPSTVTRIADGALAGNESVTAIDATAATGLGGVPDSFASGCGALAETALPATLTAIGASAFSMDASLATLTGSGVTTIGNYAFFGCTSLVMSDECAFASTGESAFDGVSYKTSDGDVYASEAAPLVAWLKSGGSSTQPGDYTTSGIKAWLTNDVANLNAYLYAEAFATNDTFTALAVSGTNFLFTAQDLATLSVAHAALQVSTDLATWKTVAESDIQDGVYTMPSATNGFARIVYSLTW